MVINVFIKRKEYFSRGVFDSDLNTLIIKKGSTINKSVAPKFNEHKYATDRENLINEGVIVDYAFTKDYKFDSPSKASSIVLGSNTNGRKYWLKDYGTNLNGFLKDIFRGKSKGKKKEVNIIEDLLAINEKEIQKSIVEIEKQIIDRTYINIDDTESMLKDIIELREKMDELKKNKGTLDSVLNIVERLWEERATD